ncbi:Hint domain-containing protein [Sulfitobacter sp. M57]|uniref:Hint domain-containing protein n=1 Tax=unclassified Sulfitobacter TaxID=196795 RepID=UPI0023E2BC74|nr:MULTISPECIES: Hint domain-containing protein [unclassified Sulfitobacter]MDF3415174.1 Hint domain-containing protein [Sulfitobacter sp. KE5]MDF3422655.1 Hint domain-containing protein [Sulfitobacter sp. KE43]MDF3433720.1 Hint domain-containing protein [Sulfitobacter sp. KE42]MDF3459360.1 Hint domain-containing protein [Sulfitobacter sp. S74]MDF3463259.1 Hint domain-containing protein [Sulfitobacter sp. Ks18]
MVAASELPINTVREGTTATQMAQTIFGDGVTVTGATYYGDRDSAGTYSGGDSVAPGVTPGDTGVILSTGEAEDFTNSSGQANQNANTSTNTSGTNNHGQYNSAAGARTYDAATLDVDFVPDTDTLTMQFVFSSEEYPEFENSIYQDFVGVWINGTLVPMDVGNGDIDPGNVNTTNNINMYVNNQNDDFNTEMDGFTISLTLTMNVNPGVTNSMRIAVADVSDARYDSNLLIAGNSIQTDLVAMSDNIDLFPDGDKVIDVLANDINNGPGTLTITHINGVAAAAGDIITLPTGQTVELNPDGTFTVTGDGDVENFNFTYTVDNGINTDVGFVNATGVPCFVAGTMIATPDGERPAETLIPGDLVLTQDDGPQPLRWIGTRAVQATGDFAPIHIRANTFGIHRDLLVSPLHRVLIRDNLAELLFGEAEVLVAARDLVNDRSVRRRAGGQVTYVHLLFDRHQVVFSEGLETESFLPGPMTTKNLEREVVNEICTIFPEIDPETGQGYSPAARRTLKRYEAGLLRAAKVA